MTDFKPGDRVRGVVEGAVKEAPTSTRVRYLVLDSGYIVYLDHLKAVEKIQPELPTEPGSVVTFEHIDDKGKPFRGILFGEKWRRLDNSDLNAWIRVDDKEIDIVSIDRVGV